MSEDTAEYGDKTSQDDVGEWFQPEDEDPMVWVRKPSEILHGFRVVDHDGAAYMEVVDQAGDVQNSITVAPGELEDTISGLEEVSNRDDE